MAVCNELEVRREPLLDRVPQRVVWGERLVGKPCPSSWARAVRCEPALDVGSLVAVAIGTGDGVAHDLAAYRAEEGRGRAGARGPFWSRAARAHLCGGSWQFSLDDASARGALRQDVVRQDDVATDSSSTRNWHVKCTSVPPDCEDRLLNTRNGVAHSIYTRSWPHQHPATCIEL